MKKWFLTSIIALVVLIAPMTLMANELITQADALFEESTLASYDKAMVLYQKAVEKEPDSFEVNWKSARVHQNYGDMSLAQKVPDWKERCAKHGKIGLNFAAKAIELKPERVEGYFYYGCSAATYSDGAGIIAILREKIISKIQKNLEKAYEIDKKFDHGGPMQALGRFWFVLPWPKKDRDKSILYLRESQKIFPDDLAGAVFLAEALLDTKKEEDKEEAKKLLQIALNPDPSKFSQSTIEIYGSKAKKILAEMD